MGGPVGRDGIKGRTLVRVGVAGHRLCPSYLLIRHHLTTGELAFHYCYLPEHQPAPLPAGARSRAIALAS